MVLNLKLRKKGIIFTIISIVISAVIISAFFFTQTTRLDAGVSSVKVRVDNINNYLNQIDTYISYQAGAQTKIVLINTIESMIVRQTYYIPIEERLKNCLIGNTECGSNFNSVLADLKELSKNQLNIDANFKINDIKFYQTNPWVITTELNITMEVNDSYASWNVTKILKGNTSIIGMKDPIHYFDNVAPAPTSDRIITTEVPFNGWIRYPSTLNRYRDTNLYFQYDGAPNFLSRLNNSLGNRNAKTGIASIVNMLGNDGSTISQLDYYFMRQTPLLCNHEPVIFDFFKYILADERARLEISDIPSQSINGFVFPLDFLKISNMSNSDYYDNLLPPC